MLYLVLILLAGIGLATVVKRIYAEGVKVGQDMKDEPEVEVEEETK